MNIQIHPETTALNPCVFRAADRMRIDGCANAVAYEGLSLALYCPFEALLDHYLNLLLVRLRQQAPEHRIEVYFPANTDSLLSRFNEVLASQSLNQAVKANDSENQAQIWIVHDAQTLPESEVQLLARLIQNFPGANIRAILLMSGKTTAQKSPLSAFGRKILRWDIEAPTEEQAQAALDQARQDGTLNAVTQLVQRIQRQQRPQLESAFQAPEFQGNLEAEIRADANPASQSQLDQQLNAFKPQSESPLQPSSAPSESPKSAGWLRRNFKLALGIAFALVMSTLVMLWIQPEAFGLKAAMPLAATAIVSPQLPTPSPTDAAPAASETGPAAAQPENPSTASSQFQVQAPDANPQATPATASPSASTPAESAIEPPESTLQGQAWLKKLDTNSFLVQHGKADSYAKVLEIQRRNPALKDAQIIAAYRRGEKLAHFVIVSGPHKSLDQAKEAAERPGIPASTARSTRGLQIQLKPRLEP